MSAALLLGACSSDEAAPTTAAEEIGAGTARAAGTRTVEVTAASLAFAPGVIRVTSGQEVVVRLASTDMRHNFTIDELDVQIESDRGETAEGRFTVAEPGRYTFYCSITGHSGAGMVGTLVVEA